MTDPSIELMPTSCEYCYFWHQGRCTRGSEGCFYLMKIKRRIRQKTKCIDCPYGRDSPCLGCVHPDKRCKQRLSGDIMEYFRR